MWAQRLSSIRRIGGGADGPKPLAGLARLLDDENGADQRKALPLVSAVSGRVAQAACLVSQKILSIWAM